jgi:hypothetical protein
MNQATRSSSFPTGSGDIVTFPPAKWSSILSKRLPSLTNAFSKNAENHMWAIALHYMHYNFCRVHQMLRVTPAMEAGIADHVWSIEEIVGLFDIPALAT